MGEIQYINVRHFQERRREDVEPRPTPANDFNDLVSLTFAIRLHMGYHYLDISKNETEVSGARIDAEGRIGTSDKSYERDLSLSTLGWLLNPELNKVPQELLGNSSFSVSQRVLKAAFSNEPTIKLERVIFALPTAHFDGDLDFSTSPLGIKIPANLDGINHGQTTSKIIFRKFIPKLHELWLKVNASVTPSYQSQNSYRPKESLLEFIQYQFTDGETVSLNELPNHPYSVLVPSVALPAFSTAAETSIDIFEKYNYKLALNELIAPVYIKSLFKFIEEKNIETAITYRKQKSSPRDGLKINSIRTASSTNVQWHLGWKNNRVAVIAELSMEDGSEFFYYSGLMIDKNNGNISVTDFEQQTKMVRKLTGNFSFSSENTNTCVKANCELEDASALAMVNGRLRTMLKENFGVNVPKLEINHLKPDEFRLQVALNSEERNQFEVRFLHVASGKCFQAISEVQFRFLSGLVGGLGKCFVKKNSEVASDRKNFSRQNDLKLLRHCGIFNHLALEYLKQISHPEGLNEEQFQDYISSAMIRSFQLVTDKKGKSTPAKKLNELFSQKLTHQITQWVHNLYFLNKEEHYFQADEKLSSTDNFNFFLAIVELVVRTLNSAHGQKLVSKQNFKDTVISGPDGDFQHVKVQMPFAYDHVLNAIDENFELIVNEQKIESVDADDVHTQIEVNSNEDASAKIDWFELHPRVFFKGKELNMSDAAKLQRGELMEFAGKYYRIKQNSLPRLKWLDFFWQNLTSHTDKERQDKENSFVTLPRSQVLNILALKKAGVDIIGGEKWQQVEKQFEKLAEPVKDPSPQFMTSSEQLKDYQRHGLKWLDDLSKLQLGGILADDMGLGKTVQALALLDLMRQEGRLDSALIVVPTTLVYNWIREGEKFFPHLPITIFDRDSKEQMSKDVKSASGKIYVCSYGMMVEHQQAFLDKYWSIVLFDEAQNLKNISAKRTGVARLLKCGNKFCLTGTPMENHYGEFFSLIDLVVSGALGEYKEFMSVFSPQKMRMNNAEFDKRHIEFLKLKTAPLILRRSKRNILKELPEKTETIVPVPFEEKQLKIYRDVAISWNNRIREKIEQNGETASQIEMLTALLRLRQICSYPAAVPKVTYDKTPPKLELLCDSLAELYANGESALVFTTFLSSLNHIEKMLKKRGIFCAKLTGDMNQKQRIAILEQFEKADVAVLLMTLKTGGVGLNLTKASYVFHVEPWWNPAAEDQATDRVHRIGQTQKVQVYRYIVEHSVEEKIQKLKGVKAKAFQALFSNNIEDSDDAESTDGFSSSQLTQKDFEFLLS